MNDQTATIAGAPVIETRDLRKWYPLRQGRLGIPFGSKRPAYLKAVDGVSLTVHAGEIMGLVGESGSGKSTTGMMLMRQEKPTSGEIFFQGLALLPGEDRRARLEFSRQAQLVFQNPYEAFNPRRTVEQSVGEPIAVHSRENAPMQRARVIRAMEMAGLFPAENYLDRFPHQLSGGQLQRTAIARAISIEPKFLVADEPVAMLDVSIRASILNLLRRFSNELSMAILYISHDLSTMRHVCSTVAVMYLGKIVEAGPVDDVLDRPLHPYAQALAAAVPVMGARGTRQRVELKGPATNASNLPSGCRFHPRCPSAFGRCREFEPALKTIPGAHQAACHLFE